MLLEALLGILEYMEWSWAFWRFLFRPAYRSELGREWRGGDLVDRFGLLVLGLFCAVVGLIPLWVVVAILATG